MPGGTLTSQISTPRATRCSESEPDMQRLSDFTWEPLSMGTSVGSRCPVESGRGWAPAGHGGEAGSVMRLLLPRLPPFAYGLLRRSESPPTGTRAPAARSIAAAWAELETGTADGSTGATARSAGGAARSTSTGISAPAAAGESRGMGVPVAIGAASAGRIRSAGRGSAHPRPASPATARAPTRRAAKRRPVTEPV